MRSLDMDGPYKLTKKEIENRVQKNGPGNFAIGRMTKDKRFLVRYVGRDDVDIKRALLGALNAATQPGFIDRLKGAEPGDDCFKFSMAAGPEAAFEKHCRHFHHFNKKGNLRNRRHPRSPSSARLKCPVCDEEY